MTERDKAILRRLDKPDHVLDIDVVKIRGLLEKARKQILHNHAGGDYVGSGFAEEDCDKFIVKALALLPEPCPTCGGSKKVHHSVRAKTKGMSVGVSIPCEIRCPDCQSQEPAKPDECEHCGCYVDAEGHGHHSVADCPLMHQPAKLPQFKDIIGLYCDDEPAEKPVLEKLAENVMAYNRERGGELSEKPDKNEFTAKIKRQYGVRNRPSWRTIVEILDRLDTANAEINSLEIRCVEQESVNLNYGKRIKQLTAKLDAAGERIKKLEAHICGEPTAKLQFPKETK